MKRQMIVMLAALVMAAPAITWAADMEKTMGDISAKAANALAIVSFKVHMETGDSNANGQAMCIDPSGVFVTTIIDSSLRADMIKEIKLTMPGREGKTYTGTFLGVDPMTGLGFIHAEGAKQGDLSAIEFAEQSNLKIGQPVISAGVVSGDANHAVAIGSGHVGALLRMPGPMVYVTGGKLTNICSPVFSAEGKAIGLVMRQMALMYQTDTPNGAMGIPLRGDDETAFFVPSDEIFQSIKNIPKAGERRRLGWIGVGNIMVLSEDKAKIEGVELPALMCDQVYDGQPAAAAGIKNNDYILEINGQKLEKLANSAYDVQNFFRQIMKMPVGTKIELTILSQGQKKKVPLTLAPVPTLPNEADRYLDQTLGMLVRARVTMDGYTFKGEAAKKEGVIVIGILKQSPAELYGLNPGDIITNVGDKAVKDIDTYKVLSEAMANGFKKGEAVKLTIFRKDQSLPISILPPRQP